MVQNEGVQSYEQNIEGSAQVGETLCQGRLHIVRAEFVCISESA